MAPERIAPASKPADVMVIGAGPAGLEAARALGQRGHRVQLLDARPEVGGRVTREALLPGLGPWRRVVEWRRGEIAELPGVKVFPASPMTAQDVLDSGARQVVVATGATWRRDGRGRSNGFAVAGHEHSDVFTPTTSSTTLKAVSGAFPRTRRDLRRRPLCDGWSARRTVCRAWSRGRVAHPRPLVSHWTQYTLEQERIEHRLRSLGVQIHPGQRCGPSGLTMWWPRRSSAAGPANYRADRWFWSLTDCRARTSTRNWSEPLATGALDSLQLIGDADAPGLIAQAVFAGHRAARQFGESVDPDAVEFLREG